MAHSYIWVFGITNEGKRILAGPFQDNYEAQNAVDDLAMSEQYTLATRDRSKAARIVKQKLRETGVPTDQALKRVHKPSSDYPGEEMDPDEPDGFMDNLKNRFNQVRGRKSPEEEIFEGDPFA